MKRHKWDSSHWKIEGHATCKVCGTVKEKHWPMLVYFVPYDHYMRDKSPDCEKVLEKVIQLKTA